MKKRYLAVAAVLAFAADGVRADLVHVSPVNAGSQPFGREMVWFAKARNARADADWEVGVGTHPGKSGSMAIAHRAWENGAATPFTLTYSPESGMATWTVGGATAAFAAPAGFDQLAIAVRGETGAGAENAAVRVMNIALTLASSGAETVLPDLEGVLGEPRQYVDVWGGSALRGGFTLTGELTMAWEGVAPRGDRMTFEVRALSAVPGPGVGVLPVLAAGWLVKMRRRGGTAG